MRNEEPAPEDVKNQGDELDPEVDLNLELSRQKLPRGIEERLSVGARNKHDTISACNRRNLRILAQRDKNLVRNEINYNDRDHQIGHHDLTAVEKHATFFKLARSEALTDQRFERTIETLHHCEAKNVDEHVAHADSGQKRRVVEVADKVDVHVLNQQV